MPRRSPLEGVNLLDLAPVPLADSEEEDGRIVLLRPKDTTTGLKGLFDRITYHLSVRRIKLDAVGSFAWRRLDGKTTVRELAKATREEFGEDAEPVEGRLGYFVRQLHGEKLVAYPGIDDGR